MTAMNDRSAPVAGGVAPGGAAREPRQLETYHWLVRLKRRLPEWLLYRLDPYNTVADRFVADAGRQVEPGARVLDAGAGDCRHAVHFPHARYLGVDNARGDATAYDYGRLSLLCGLGALPLAADRLDAAICVNVLEHVAEPERCLAELHRVLRPGGRLFLVAPQSWQVHQAPQDFLRFTRFGLEHLLGKVGFAVDSLEPSGGIFWNLGCRSLYLLTHFRGPWRPVGLLLSPLLGFLLPLLCFYLDPLDRSRDDTLGYRVVARKPGG